MRVLPIFPLGSVLLPGMPLPLQVFEPRYLSLLEDVLPADGAFGVVLIERGFEVGGGDHRFDVGTVASVDRVLPEGPLVQLVAHGEGRFVVERWLPDDPYPRAEVRELPGLPWSDDLTAQLAATERTVRRALAVASEYSGGGWPADVGLSDDPVTAAWQLAGIAPVGPLDQLRLLRSASVAELLDGIEEVTSGALEALRMMLPPDEAGGSP